MLIEYAIKIRHIFKDFDQMPYLVIMTIMFNRILDKTEVDRTRFRPVRLPSSGVTYRPEAYFVLIIRS